MCSPPSHQGHLFRGSSFFFRRVPMTSLPSIEDWRRHGHHLLGSSSSSSRSGSFPENANSSLCCQTVGLCRRHPDIQMQQQRRSWSAKVQLRWLRAASYQQSGMSGAESAQRLRSSVSFRNEFTVAIIHFCIFRNSWIKHGDKTLITLACIFSSFPVTFAACSQCSQSSFIAPPHVCENKCFNVAVWKLPLIHLNFKTIFRQKKT